MRTLLGWTLAVTLAAIVTALTLGAVMATAPGLLVLFPLAAAWYAADLPVFDFDLELSRLLEA